MKKLLLIILLYQQQAFSQKVFTDSELVAVVKRFHPVARQAFIDVQIADANILASRGSFDPAAMFDKSRKTFDGTNYYDQQFAELKIPTWYGLDVYAGRETIEGNRINPEETKGTIDYIGVSVPLAQNLLFDKRRAALQQAKAFRLQSEEERRAMVNDLVADALQTYWNWWEQYQVLSVVEATLQNALTRLEMVKTFYRLGERAAIDTLEAVTQVQSIQQRKTKALLDLQQARIELSAYLWTQEDIAYELPADARPSSLQQQRFIALDSLLTAARMHPDLLRYQYKLQVLEIDKRVKFQALLPQVNAKYQFIGRSLNSAVKSGLFENNYRYGISMSLPLRLSEGRGEYKAARLKLEQTRLDQELKQVLISNKIKQSYVEWQQTSQLLNLQTEMVINYVALLRAEETKFSNGESSLFLMNAREIKAIEEQQKLVEINAKMRQTEVKVRWAAGLLINE